MRRQVQRLVILSMLALSGAALAEPPGRSSARLLSAWRLEGDRVVSVQLECAGTRQTEAGLAVVVRNDGDQETYLALSGGESVILAPGREMEFLGGADAVHCECFCTCESNGTKKRTPDHSPCSAADPCAQKNGRECVFQVTPEILGKNTNCHERDVPDAPACKLDGIKSGPPAEIDIQVQDLVNGLSAIHVTVDDNADVSVPPFEPGTEDPVEVTALKIDPNLASRVELSVVDRAGNVTRCDPILAQIVKGKGRSHEESFAGLDAAEHVLMVTNGDPGLSRLEVQVNGVTFRVRRLQDREIRTIDLSRAMLPGGHNAITLRSDGRRGAKASVLIWDGGGR